MKEKRDVWKAEQPKLDPDQLVFIDETWATTNMTRRYGRCPKGQRLICPVPHGHWKSITFVAALRTDGLTAPMVLDGPMNGDRFVKYIETVLVPTLKPGNIVILDNLSCHKRSEVVELIERAGASVRFLPPYSPDLNPIELSFSKLKGLLRSAEKRTVDTLKAFLKKSVKAFAPEECKGYFRRAGYGSPTDATTIPNRD